MNLNSCSALKADKESEEWKPSRRNSIIRIQNLEDQDLKLQNDKNISSNYKTKIK